MKEWLACFDEKDGLKTLRRRLVDIPGPITREEFEQQKSHEFRPLSSEELDKWEPSGLPRLTHEEVREQLFTEICSEVLFSFSAGKLSNEEFETIELYRTDKGGRLSTIEIEARRLRQTDRASVRVSTTIFGDPSVSLPNKLSLRDLSNGYQKTVRLSNGTATFYKMKSGEYGLNYLNSVGENPSLINREYQNDKIPVPTQKIETIVYEDSSVQSKFPFLGVEAIRNNVLVLGKAAVNTVFFRRS